MRIRFFDSMRIGKNDVTVAILSGVALAFIGVYKLYPYIGNGQDYIDLIVGALTWIDYDKEKEWRTLNLFFGGSILFSTFFAAFFAYLRAQAWDNYSIQEVRQLFGIAWIPAIFWLGNAFMRPDVPSFMLNVSAMLVIIIALIALGLSRFKDGLAPKDITDIGISAVLLLILSFFSILAISVALGKFSADLRGLLFQKWSLILVRASVASTILFIIISLFTARTIGALKRRLSSGLLLLQISLPLLLFVFISQSYVYQGKILAMYRSDLLLAVAGVLTLFSWWRLFKRYGEIKKKEMEGLVLPYSVSLSVASLYPVVVFVSYIQNSWRTYSFATDDFHVGEQLLPWQQIIDFGKLPYHDFVPIHGLMAMAYGGLNKLFWGNTIATFPLAMTLLIAIAVTFSFVALFRFAGPLIALSLASFAGGGMNRMFVLLPAIILLCLPELTKRPGRWLAVWIAVCLFSVLYNVPVGAGIALGSIPIAAYMGWRVFREERRLYLRAGVVLGAMTLLILGISPMRNMAAGLIHFIIDNASTNTIANGSGLFQYDLRPKEFGLAAVPFQWQSLKLSWILVVLISVIYFFRTIANIKEHGDKRYFWLAALLPGSFFITGKWALERIAASGLERDGALSITALTFFLPLMIMGYSRESERLKRALFSAFIVGMATAAGYGVMNYRSWITKPFESIIVSEKDALVKGKDIGLPRLGKVFADPKRVEKLQELKQAMMPYLRDGETFLDLTNHSALYFYLDMPVPVLYSADYVAASAISQMRMVKQIKETPPPVVLISERIPWDGGPASLRSYLLYRELVNTYVPVKAGMFSFLVRPDRVDSINIAPFEQQMEVLDEVFYQADLKEIPNAWGRSWRLLKNRFTKLHTLVPGNPVNFTRSQNGGYKPTGEDPQINFEMPKNTILGADVDHIMLEYSCKKNNPGSEPVLELYWASEIYPMSEKTVVRFSGKGTRAIVPVGSQPRWRLGKQINALRLDLQDYRSCSELNVTNAVLLKLN
ncbi:MAG: hypothetical protein Q7T53_02105 [Deltaproteobacteria bacterium]|nr:hypothetical protein [Deltaproteobacteria bacterium]